MSQDLLHHQKAYTCMEMTWKSCIPGAFCPTFRHLHWRGSYLQWSFIIVYLEKRLVTLLSFLSLLSPSLIECFSLEEIVAQWFPKGTLMKDDKLEAHTLFCSTTIPVFSPHHKCIEENIVVYTVKTWLSTAKQRESLAQ